MARDEERYEDEDAEDDDEDDEEEEEGQDEYEKDDFIVDEEEEEEAPKEDSDEEAKAKKKEKKRRKRDAEEDFALDEEDYDLLEEANARGFRRPLKSDSSKKFKRLKKAGKGGGEDGRAAYQGLSDEETRRGRTAEEELQHELFGDYEGGLPEDVVEEQGDDQREEEEEDGEEDEMADFIVDEDVDEEGQLYSKRKVKKKKSRMAGEVSSYAIEEARDIFGDVSVLLDDHRQREVMSMEQEEDLGDDGYGRHGRKAKLEQQFEPSLLAERYMTEKDDLIREIDVPERIQLLEEMVGSFPDPGEDKTVEAMWIYDRVFGMLYGPPRPEFQHICRLDKQDAVKQIINVLQLLHEKRLEVPFIAMYRQEHCPDLVRDSSEAAREYSYDMDSDDKPKLRRLEALWAVQQWDKKWLMLRRRKTTLKAAYQRRVQGEVVNEMAKEDLLAKLLVALNEAQSEVSVDDVDAKFNLHFPADDVEAEQGQFKRPKRRSFYSICRKAGVGSVTKYFGLSPAQFGENLQAMYKRHEKGDTPLFPEQVAAEAAASSVSEFSDPASVLKGARHMAAVEIFCEPAVREYVRNIFNERCVVTTKPTLDGNSAIDSFHKYGPVKWLLNKPVGAFDDGQWLLIQKAEEEKLLTVTIGLPQEVVDNVVMQEFESCYISDGVSKAAQAWNDQRRQILKEALFSLFVPSMAKEMRMTLSARAKHWVAMQCASDLWNRVSVAPYLHAKIESEDHVEVDGAPVLACCWGPGNPPTTFVMLDMAGEMIDKIETAHMHVRSQTASQEQQKKKGKNQKDLLDCMKDHKPHVLVVGAAKLCCRNLKEEIVSEVIFKILEEYPRELPEGLEIIDHVFGDETLPSLYENSRISEEQIPGQPGIVRRAVALGRYLQNPLAMVASLCGPRREILSLKFHPLQEYLSNDEVYEGLEQVMITITNQVGVDINLAASHEWLFAPLQFVCGLGPRKAAYIQRFLRGQRLNTRKEMITAHNLVGRSVFINAAGFIRVRGIGQGASANQIMDVLDDTRIHPESYELAKKLAEYAYSEEYGNDRDDEEDLTAEMAVERVRDNPSLLTKLDIEKFLTTMPDKGDRGPGKKQETLQLIISELLDGYHEWREPYTKPSDEAIFDMLTGENEDSLAVGRLVHASVRKVQENRVLCMLDSGLLGIVQKEDLSDDKCHDPSEKVSEGSVITCRIKDINKTKFLVDLTCRGSELRDEYRHARFVQDPYYSEDTTALKSQQEKVKVKKDDGRSKGFRPRMIVHPHFQNIPMAAAIEALKEKDVGEVIIRPSSKGPSHLSMTLKFFDGVYTHIDILESGKESRDLTSFLRLGKILSIGDETFEDLDEVIARYVDPLASHLREMCRYRKFRRGTKAEVDESLHMDKSTNPMRIHYCFSVAYDHPGAFMLSYIRSINIHHEYISVSPNGFKYRKRYFDSPDKLVSYFQKHHNDPMPEPPPRRAVAAMVVPRSPAPGGTPQMSAGGWGSTVGSMPGMWGHAPGQVSSSGWGSNRSSDRIDAREGSGWGSAPRNSGDTGWTQTATNGGWKSATTSGADDTGWGQQSNSSKDSEWNSAKAVTGSTRTRVNRWGPENATKLSEWGSVKSALDPSSIALDTWGQPSSSVAVPSVVSTSASENQYPNAGKGSSVVSTGRETASKAHGSSRWEDSEPAAPGTSETGWSRKDSNREQQSGRLD